MKMEEEKIEIMINLCNQLYILLDEACEKVRDIRIDLEEENSQIK